MDSPFFFDLFIELSE